jgi:hypothetical protein
MTPTSTCRNNNCNHSINGSTMELCGILGGMHWLAACTKEITTHGYVKA